MRSRRLEAWLLDDFFRDERYSNGPWPGDQAHLLILDCANARRQCKKSNEPGGVALLIHVVFAKRHETLIVQRVDALTSHDGGGSLVQPQRDSAGDALLRHVDERVVRFPF